MAKKMMDPIDILPQNVIQLMEFTGLDQISAENLLEIADYNLQLAINYHLENINELGGNSGGGSTSSATAVDNLACSDEVAGPGQADLIEADLPNSAVVPDDGVRAPIPAKREQLVMPGDDNFRYRKRRHMLGQALCPFRNFAREAELQEEQLNTYLEGDSLSSSGGGISQPQFGVGMGRAMAVPVSLPGVMTNFLPTHKRAGLEDLFRPPVDILFWGTFRAARDYATAENRWLIVNLQDMAEFRSQIINRDIWSDLNLRGLIQEHFVLWQISVDNPDGLRFKTFYKVKSMPYICIIDPRTGEEKKILDAVTSQIFTVDLYEYLNSNSYTLEARGGGASTSSSRSRPTCTITKPSHESVKCGGPHGSADTSGAKPAAELSEEDQMAIAIKNSLHETATRRDDDSNDSDTDADDVIVVSDSEEDRPFEELLGNKNDPLTMIRLRLPDGLRTLMRWPSSTPLRAINLYLQIRHPKETKEPYKIISAYPRMNILELDEWTTLAEAKLHPSAILYLHIDN